MKIEPIADDLVEDLLAEQSPGSSMGHNIPEQFGPLRQYEKAMRCACRGCSSPTFYKVSGIPRCMTHALRELNLMLHSAYPKQDWRYTGKGE